VLIVIGGLLLWRRNRRGRPSGHNEQEQYYKSELPADSVPPHYPPEELPGHELQRPPTELPAVDKAHQGPPTELPADYEGHETTTKQAYEMEDTESVRRGLLSHGGE
jgi:hypothetical protein